MVFKYQLYNEIGNHDWEPIKSDSKFIDHKGEEYEVHKCTKCGMTAQTFKGSTYYVGPQYPQEFVFKCPEEIGLFKHPENGALIAVLGDDKVIKKKKKKNKKMKRTKTLKMVRTK